MEENAQAVPARGNGNGHVSQIPKAISPDVDQLTRDLRAFVSDCETLLKNAATLSGSGAAIARTQLSEGMAAAKLRLDALRVSASDRATQTRAATEEYVRREPMKAIAYAAVAGAILGVLMSRR